MNLINTYRICSICRELKKFDYNKITGHGVCSQCGNAYNNIKLTKEMCEKMIAHFNRVSTEKKT